MVQTTIDMRDVRREAADRVRRGNGRNGADSVQGKGGRAGVMTTTPDQPGTPAVLRIVVTPSATSGTRPTAAETTAVRLSSLLPPAWRSTARFLPVGFSLAVVLPGDTAAWAAVQALRHLWGDPGLNGWQWRLDPQETSCR